VLKAAGCGMFPAFIIPVPVFLFSFVRRWMNNLIIHTTIVKYILFNLSTGNSPAGYSLTGLSLHQVYFTDAAGAGLLVANPPVVPNGVPGDENRCTRMYHVLFIQ
jgi:hypothetical protein